MTELCFSFAEQIRARRPDFSPEIALILGSGLGDLASLITDAEIIKYSDIAGFPTSKVSGHAGQFVLGVLHGRKVICMQGRVHLYEGYSPSVIAQIIRTFKLLGVRYLVVTNAAGSLNLERPAGSIMLISDHINLSGFNPLMGPNDDNSGPRFPDMSNAYDADLRTLAHQVAAEENIAISDGVYLMVSGPNFETAAEVRAFARLGADAVGMSTVPEVIAAVHCGIKVLGFSVITNLATGLAANPLSHQETLSAAEGASVRLANLLNHIIKRM